MTREQLLAVAGKFRSLEEVTRWTFAAATERMLVEVVTQDEYTHDVIVEAAAAAATYLVFDTT
jgi:hypothetical protein